MELPVAFLKEMKKILQSEFELFINSYEAPPFQGVRLNKLKCGLETLEKSLPFPISPSPFSSASFYGNGQRVGLLAAHHAGMFYSQEPSASSAVTVLAPKPGEKVLDLCAAPGGKSTQIAAEMMGEGLLWANEIVHSRAQILLSNIERMGVSNAVVSSCHPQKLCEALEGYFDRVLVDAPCSGEGMFRRDPSAVAQWSEQAVLACAQRQRAVLDSAALAVCEGGVLVYSTCTFSEEENEGTARMFLEKHPEFELLPFDEDFGRPVMNMAGRRIFPMDGGEGHFVAKFRRTGKVGKRVEEYSLSPSLPVREAAKIYEEIFLDKPCARILENCDRIYLLPDVLPKFSGLGVLRVGVELGQRREKRIEPAHALFMSKSKGDFRSCVDFSSEDSRLLAFLRGEEIACEISGYTAVCVNGVTAGFGKASGGRLKNHYPKGLRNKK